MRTRALPGLVALAAVVVATVPLARTSAQPAPSIAGVTARPFVGITLQDAVGMALLQNPNLAVSASNVRVARYQIVEAKAPFDVQLRLEPSSSFSVTPPENLFFSGPGGYGIHQCFNKFSGMFYSCPTSGPGNIIQHQYSFQGGITGQSISGTTYSAGITRTRTYNNTLINTFNPYYQSSLNFSVTQPLLRNFGMNAAKRDLKLSLVRADASQAQTLQDALNTLSQVEDAYWDLVAAWRNVAIQEEALNQAIAQQRSAARLARRGAAPPIAAVESETQVANFQASVYSALQNVSELQNQLKSLIVTDSGDPIWKANLVPSSPVQQLPAAGDVAAIVALAQENRPEVRQAEDRRRQADLDRAYARNQELPQADVQAQYMSNGFAGVLAPIPNFEVEECAGLPSGVCPTPPPETQGKAGKATANMWAWRYPAFNIALIFNVPIENTLAHGLLRSANEEEHQAQLLVQGVNERIGVEARTALQNYQSTLSRIYSASQSRQAAEAVYASEVRRFHAGASTTFLVLQRQVQLAEARGRELQAQTDLNKAVVELERVEGTLLRDNGVDLQTLGSKALPSLSP